MAALQWCLKRLYISKAPIAICCFCQGKTGLCLEGMIWPMFLQQVPEMSTPGILGGQQLTFKWQSIHHFSLVFWKRSSCWVWKEVKSKIQTFYSSSNNTVLPWRRPQLLVQLIIPLLLSKFKRSNSSPASFPIFVADFIFIFCNGIYMTFYIVFYASKPR